MMERMTLAEDLGYNDSYFPVAEETQPAFATSDPSEYILSHSPPSAMSAMELMTSMDLPVGQEQQREAEIEEAQERLETGDGLHDSPELRMEEEVGVRSALEHEAPMDVEVGTHMSPTHPGYLEHRPSAALGPGELQSYHGPSHGVSPHDASQGEVTPTDRDLHSGHVAAPQPPPKPRRRKSHSTHNQVAEAVFYSDGVSVFFGFQEGEEREIMEDCEGAGVWMRGRDEDDWEVEEFHYVVSGVRHVVSRVLLMNSTTLTPSTPGFTTTCSVGIMSHLRSSASSLTGPPLTQRSIQVPLAPVQVIAFSRARPVNQTVCLRSDDAGVPFPHVVVPQGTLDDGTPPAQSARGAQDDRKAFQAAHGREPDRRDPRWV